MIVVILAYLLLLATAALATRQTRHARRSIVGG
jgi:hypothetical protein